MAELLPPALASLAAPVAAFAPEAILSQAGQGFMLVFARIGTALMLLPGLGELWVPMRVRLALALSLTTVLLPALLPELPTGPVAPAQLALLLGHELVIGLFMGFCVRATATAVMVAGSVIALQAGLANALQPGVVTPDATAILGVFLGLLAIVWLVNTGQDHVILTAIVDSYALLPPALPNRVALPVEALLAVTARTVAEAFGIGLRLTLPVLGATLLLNLALGLANRFMQQLQVYFITVPLAILLALGLVMLSVPAMLRLLEGELAATIARLGGAG